MEPDALLEAESAPDPALDPEPAPDPLPDPALDPDPESDMLPEPEPLSLPDPEPALPEAELDPESDPDPEPEASPWESESPVALPLPSSMPLEVAEPSLPTMLGAEEDILSGLVACCPPQAARIKVQAIAGASLNRERDMVEFSSFCAFSRLAMNNEISDPMHRAKIDIKRAWDDSDRSVTIGRPCRLAHPVGLVGQLLANAAVSGDRRKRGLSPDGRRSIQDHAAVRGKRG